MLGSFHLEKKIVPFFSLKYQSSYPVYAAAHRKALKTTQTPKQTKTKKG